MSRRADLAASHWRYDYDLTPECAYCGQRADTRDHVPPLRFAGSDLDLPRGKSWRLVSACRECNSLLGGRPLLTVAARREYLLDRYRKRYARLLEAPPWTQAEIDELGHSLRTSVMQQEGERRRALKRLRWLRGER